MKRKRSDVKFLMESLELRRETGLTNARKGGLFAMKHSAVSMTALGFKKEIAKDKKAKIGSDRIIWRFDV